MNYYWLAADSAAEIGIIQEVVDKYTFLPRVSNLVCGHIRWWNGASIPIEVDALDAMVPWVGTTCRPGTVSEDAWREIDASLNTLFESAGSGTPWIYPGLRLGCAVVRVDDTSWHYSQRGAVELYSEELIECFRRGGGTTFNSGSSGSFQKSSRTEVFRASSNSTGEDPG